jgi:RNA polymerase sigma-70 factor (ECF subfamily)
MAVKAVGVDIEDVARRYPMAAVRFKNEVWPLRSYCCAVAFEVVHDYYAAEEVVQDAFIKVWLAFVRYAYRSKGEDLPVLDMQAWLATIVFNTAIDYSRHESRRVVLTLDHGEFLDVLGHPSDRPDMIFEDVEGVDELDVLLRKLPERYRSALEMRYLQGLTYEQMARKMRCEVELARVVVHRATKSFAQVVKEAGVSETALGRWLKTWITIAEELEVDAIVEQRLGGEQQVGVA